MKNAVKRAKISLAAPLPFESRGLFVSHLFLTPRVFIAAAAALANLRHHSSEPLSFPSFLDTSSRPD
jgi:hypothetical protein